MVYDEVYIVYDKFVITPPRIYLTKFGVDRKILKINTNNLWKFSEWTIFKSKFGITPPQSL